MASRHSTKSGSVFRKPAVAVAVVIGVVLPIVWVMLRDDGNSYSAGDQSIPYSTMTDDKYAPTTRPIRATTTPTVSPTPSRTPSTQTPSRTPTTSPSDDDPSRTPTPGRSRSASPTTDPTGSPSRPLPSRDTEPARTTGPTTNPPTTSTTPSATPTPTPTPTDNGSMRANELELFGMINAARVDKGCAELDRRTSLTGSARSHAQAQAEAGKTQTGGGTDAISDGKSTRSAYDDMMGSYRSTLLDCGRDTLGIGYGYDESGLCPLLCNRKTRWVADFA